MFVYITVGWQCFKYIFFLSVYLSRVDLNRQSPVTSIQAVHLHISENINMKCYVEPAAARQDPTSSDEMQLASEISRYVYFILSKGRECFNELCSVFFWDFTQWLVRHAGKIHRRSLNITFSWLSKLHSFNILNILSFRRTASVCCVGLSRRFWHRCRLFSPHLSDVCNIF